MSGKLVFLDSFRTGHPVIDKDHHKIINLVNLLVRNIEGANGQDGKKYFDELCLFVTDHFRREEKILKDLGFPNYANHVAYHQALSSQIGKVRDDYRSTMSSESAAKAVNDIMDFIVHDVVTKDLEFKSYFVEIGIGDREF